MPEVRMARASGPLHAPGRAGVTTSMDLHRVRGEGETVVGEDSMPGVSRFPSSLIPQAFRRDQKIFEKVLVCARV